MVIFEEEPRELDLCFRQPEAVEIGRVGTSIFYCLSAGHYWAQYHAEMTGFKPALGRTRSTPKIPYRHTLQSEKKPEIHSYELHLDIFIFKLPKIQTTPESMREFLPEYHF